MKKYRVSVEDIFCRDVFLEAESEEEARRIARGEQYNEDDWCEGHALEVMDVKECDDDWNEL